MMPLTYDTSGRHIDVSDPGQTGTQPYAYTFSDGYIKPLVHA